MLKRHNVCLCYVTWDGRGTNSWHVLLHNNICDKTHDVYCNMSTTIVTHNIKNGYFIRLLHCIKHLDLDISPLNNTRYFLPGGTEAQCYLCGEAKDFSEMLFCTSCGRHYHGRCLDPAVDLTSLVRMSWQCPDCKVCQGCRYKIIYRWMLIKYI
jgi:hypothetical protein